MTSAGRGLRAPGSTSSLPRRGLTTGPTISFSEGWDEQRKWDSTLRVEAGNHFPPQRRERPRIPSRHVRGTTLSKTPGSAGQNGSNVTVQRERSPAALTIGSLHIASLSTPTIRRVLHRRTQPPHSLSLPRPATTVYSRWMSPTSMEAHPIPSQYQSKLSNETITPQGITDRNGFHNIRQKHLQGRRRVYEMTHRPGRLEHLIPVTREKQLQRL